MSRTTRRGVDNVIPCYYWGLSLIIPYELAAISRKKFIIFPDRPWKYPNLLDVTVARRIGCLVQKDKSLIVAVAGERRLLLWQLANY